MHSWAISNKQMKCLHYINLCKLIRQAVWNEYPSPSHLPPLPLLSQSQVNKWPDLTSLLYLSNSLYNGCPLIWTVVLSTYMFFILLPWFKHFCLYCASFFLTVSVKFSEIFSFLLGSNKLYPTVHLMNFISAVFSLLISLCFNAQFHGHIKVIG